MDTLFAEVCAAVVLTLILLFTVRGTKFTHAGFMCGLYVGMALMRFDVMRWFDWYLIALAGGLALMSLHQETQLVREINRQQKFIEFINNLKEKHERAE